MITKQVIQLILIMLVGTDVCVRVVLVCYMLVLPFVLVRIKQSPFIAELNGVSVVAVAAVKNTFRYKHCIYSRSQFSDTWVPPSWIT